MLQQGSIVKAWVCDPQGHNPKPRNLIVTTPTAEIAAAEELATVALTGEFILPLKWHDVEMPYSTNPADRNRGSRLIKPCVAMCTWQPVIRKDAIIAEGGYIPATKLTEVLKILIKLKQTSP